MTLCDIDVILFQEELSEAAMEHRHEEGIYDHCSGDWCLKVTHRHRADLPEKACLETGKGDGAARQRQLCNLCLRYPIIVKSYTGVVCGCTDPYDVWTHTGLYGPCTTWQKSHGHTGYSRAPFGAARILFTENRPKTVWMQGPGMWYDWPYVYNIRINNTLLKLDRRDGEWY